ncbi:MAG: hypothetical protein EPO08_02455 [Rhodospirillaceae bacterium]|nr:MAG: hypothetical protein EPO08_02455 [Rhodospirillaceae bacterium]
MSRSISELFVTTGDPVAEIIVSDGNLGRVARGTAELRVQLPYGLYQVRVRAGSEAVEKIVKLDKPAITVPFDQIPVPSPLLPTDNSAEAMAQSNAVRNARAEPAYFEGESSYEAEARILLFVRQDARAKPSSKFGLLAGLSILDAAGKMALAEQVPGASGDNYAACAFAVRQGFYRLRFDGEDSPIERSVFVTSGWDTQIFMPTKAVTLRKSSTDDAPPQRPDISRGTIVVSRGISVEPWLARLTQVAEFALTRQRKILSKEMRALLSDKFDYPMLGLVAAHLLLRESPSDPLLTVVIRNLAYLLGQDHPDVQALFWALPHLGPPVRPLSGMPLLKASWDLVIAASRDHPEIVPFGSICGQISLGILPEAPWLMWTAPSQEDSSLRLERKAAAANAFLREYKEQELADAALEYRVHPGDGSPSMAVETFSFDTGGLARGGAPSSPDLPPDAKVELMQSLGLPKAVLEQMLAPEHRDETVASASTATTSGHLTA